MEIILGILSVILGIVGAALAYRQIRMHRLLSSASEYMKIHDKIIAVGSRQRTVELLPKVVERAVNGDTLFGHCRICTGYPNEFYQELTRAVGRGVRIQAVVADTPEAQELTRFLLGLDPEHVDLKIHRGDIYASIFGIRGKEVVLCYHMTDRSVGIYFRDPIFTKYIENAFDHIWGKIRQRARIP